MIQWYPMTRTKWQNFLSGCTRTAWNVDNSASLRCRCDHGAADLSIPEISTLYFSSITRGDYRNEYIQPAAFRALASSLPFTIILFLRPKFSMPIMIGIWSWSFTFAVRFLKIPFIAIIGTEKKTKLIIYDVALLNHKSFSNSYFSKKLML